MANSRDFDKVREYMLCKIRLSKSRLFCNDDDDDDDDDGYSYPPRTLKFFKKIIKEQEVKDRAKVAQLEREQEEEERNRRNREERQFNGGAPKYNRNRHRNTNRAVQRKKPITLDNYISFDDAKRLGLGARGKGPRAGKRPHPNREQGNVVVPTEDDAQLNRKAPKLDDERQFPSLG